MKNEPLKIAASLWSANLAELGQSIINVDKYCYSYHFDIMDGHFVPNLLFGPDIIKALRPYTKKPFEVHFMVENTEALLNEFLQSGADFVTIHPEVCDDYLRIIRFLHHNDKKAGIAVNVEIPGQEFEKILPEIDYIVLMGTKLGIKGVSISPEVFGKIAYLRNVIDRNNYPVNIQIDGGIRENTVPELYQHGADIVTAGSLLFNNDFEKVTQWFRSLSRESAAATKL